MSGMIRNRDRRSIRLQDYDYTQTGAYFLTICASQRECLFGDVSDGVMHRNAVGDVITDTWIALPLRFAGVTLDEFVVMPNHVHGILCIGDVSVGRAEGAGRVEGVGRAEGAASSAPTISVAHSRPQLLGDIVRAFKSISANTINRLLQRQGQPLWQRNYYERIIRDNDEWNRIREYIINNPARWADDDENPLRHAPMGRNPI